jgi:predicted CxxxxCH...CXXCH cytochrome family protein
MVPPQDNAHVIHSGAPVFPPTMGYGEVTMLEDYNPAAFTATEYKFGCGQCHPMETAKHVDGTVDVEVSSVGAPAGSLRAMNDLSASYAGTVGQGNGSCSGVSCHSSGQDMPVFASSPAWNTTTPISCDACHGNPPRYASGAPGSVTANSHIAVDDWGWVAGHFLGVGAVGHADRHGDPTSSEAAITCQTCHYESTDPASTGPSGFYWLNTTGSYDYTGTDPAQGSVACTTCHGITGGPVARAGKVLALRHVNGTRDVSFDPRTVIDPAIAYLPAPPNRPTKPYWRAGDSTVTWLDAVINGTTASMSMAGSTYDPATKTCTVACHNLNPVSGPAAAVWGTPFAWDCRYCHGDKYAGWY